MSDSSLYHQAIVKTARAAIGAGRLPQADGSSMVDNPLCGDRVTVDVCLEAGRVTSVGHVVRGCLLCEAAAALIAEESIGETADELRCIVESVESMLVSEPPPALAWTSLDMFSPVRGYKSRHLCVLLPFQALLGALEESEGRASAG